MFPSKASTSDKPWTTDWLRSLVRRGQEAYMSGDINHAKILRNKVNHAARKLKHDVYQTQIASLTAEESYDLWRHNII